MERTPQWNLEEYQACAIQVLGMRPISHDGWRVMRYSGNVQQGGDVFWARIHRGRDCATRSERWLTRPFRVPAASSTANHWHCLLVGQANLHRAHPVS